MEVFAVSKRAAFNKFNNHTYVTSFLAIYQKAYYPHEFYCGLTTIIEEMYEYCLGILYLSC